jgi:hypothetical protein
MTTNNLGHKLRYPEKHHTVTLDLRGKTVEELNRMRDELRAKCIQIEQQRAVKEARVAAGIAPLDEEWWMRSGKALAITQDQVRQIDAARGMEALRYVAEELRADAHPDVPAPSLRRAVIEACDFILNTLNKMES